MPSCTSFNTLTTPLEFVFQEQSYSSLHSGRSLAWDHFRGDIDDPCGIVTDFCGVIADFCGVIADPCVVITDLCGVVTIVEQLTKYRKMLLNIVKIMKHF